MRSTRARPLFSLIQMSHQSDSKVPESNRVDPKPHGLRLVAKQKRLPPEIGLALLEQTPARSVPPPTGVAVQVARRQFHHRRAVSDQLEDTFMQEGHAEVCATQVGHVLMPDHAADGSPAACGCCPRRCANGPPRPTLMKNCFPALDGDIGPSRRRLFNKTFSPSFESISIATARGSSSESPFQSSDPRPSRHETVRQDRRQPAIEHWYSASVHTGAKDLSRPHRRAPMSDLIIKGKANGRAHGR